MLRVVTAAVALLMLLPCAAFAQKRKATATRGSARAAKAATALIQEDRMRVVESIRTLGDNLHRLEFAFSDDPTLRIYYDLANKLSEDVETAADARVEVKLMQQGGIIAQ